MPLPVRRKSRRDRPWSRAASSLSSARRASYSFCCGVCGGGMNSSLEAMRAGIGRASWSSMSHWRTHMAGILGGRGRRRPAEAGTTNLGSVVAVVVAGGRRVVGDVLGGPAEGPLEPAAEQGGGGEGGDGG